MWGENRSVSAREPALDGLRGLAVAGVLLFHGGFAWAAGGFLGVSIFFTLSGFLITSLLLNERERGRRNRISLRRFWARRARRILPAALVALAGIALYGLTVADPQQRQQLGGDGLSALTQVANWRFVLSGHSYASLFSAPSPVQHFWSLAIEEQFYLLFPLIVVVTLVATRGSRRALAIVIATLAIGSTVLAALLFSPGQDPSRVYYGTDTRAVELLVGVLLAIALAGRSRLEGTKVRLAVAALGAVALVLLVSAWGLVDQGDDLLYRGGLALHAVLVATVIAAVLVPGPVRAALAVAPLRALGLVSYGVYLYHWPIFLWLTPERTGLDGAALFGERMAFTLAAAIASYFLIEQPIRHGRRITGWKPVLFAPALAAALALVFVVVTSSVGRNERIVFGAVRDPNTALAKSTVNRSASLPLTGPSSGQAQSAGATAPSSATPAPLGAAPTPGPTTAPPAPPPVTRMLIVGDSVAQTLGRGLERWGPQHGVAVMNGARFYCGIARGGRVGFALGHTLDRCSDWETRWGGMLDRLHPDVVVVLSTIWDVGGRQRDVWGPDYVDQGDPRFDQFVVDEWARAADVLSSRGARVVWLTAPCAADAGVSEKLQYSNTHYLPELLSARSVVKVDLAGGVCPDGKFTDRLGPVADGRPDGMHFSDQGADWIASWLAPNLTNPFLQNPAVSAGRARRF